MTAQILASELGNLIQESKRKNNDLRSVSWLMQLIITPLLMNKGSRKVTRGTQVSTYYFGSSDSCW